MTGVESSGELKVTAGAKVSDRLDEESGRRLVRIKVRPGKARIDFEHVGNGKSIIQDPMLKVVSGTK